MDHSILVHNLYFLPRLQLRVLKTSGLLLHSALKADFIVNFVMRSKVLIGKLHTLYTCINTQASSGVRLEPGSRSLLHTMFLFLHVSSLANTQQ